VNAVPKRTTNDPSPLHPAPHTFILTGTGVARKALREDAHRFAASGLDPRRHPGALAAMSSTPQPATQMQVSPTQYLNNQQCLRRSSARMRDQSRRRPSQGLGVELVQQLLEGFFSCPAGRRHSVKIDRRLLYRASSSGTINLPPPRVRRRCPALHGD
jgi:hypothetical protein